MSSFYRVGGFCPPQAPPYPYPPSQTTADDDDPPYMPAGPYVPISGFSIPSIGAPQLGLPQADCRSSHPLPYAQETGYGHFNIHSSNGHSAPPLFHIAPSSQHAANYYPQDAQYTQSSAPYAVPSAHSTAQAAPYDGTLPWAANIYEGRSQAIKDHFSVLRSHEPSPDAPTRSFAMPAPSMSMPEPVLGPSVTENHGHERRTWQTQLLPPHQALLMPQPSTSSKMPSPTPAVINGRNAGHALYSAPHGTHFPSPSQFVSSGIVQSVPAAFPPASHPAPPSRLSTPSYPPVQAQAPTLLISPSSVPNQAPRSPLTAAPPSQPPAYPARRLSAAAPPFIPSGCAPASSSAAYPAPPPTLGLHPLPSSTSTPPSPPSFTAIPVSPPITVKRASPSPTSLPSSPGAPWGQDPPGSCTVNVTSSTVQYQSTNPTPSSLKLSIPAHEGTSDDFRPLLRSPGKPVSHSLPPPSRKVAGSRRVQHFKLARSRSPLPVRRARCAGKKKALLIGINYRGTDLDEIFGAIEDAKNMEGFLMKNYDFAQENIMVLTDDADCPERLPTHDNILAGIRWLVRDASMGDSLFFLFSGHGWQQPDMDGDEQDGQDEVIAPMDYSTKRVIVDDTLHDLIVNPLPKGCQLVALIDACHSGSALDLPYVYDTKGNLKPSEVTTAHMQSKTAPADVIMWSGCKDAEDADDADDGSAMVSAFMRAVVPNQRQSLLDVLVRTRDELKKHNYKQKPQFSCSHLMDVNTLFVM